MNKVKITARMLRELLEYDREAVSFTWKARPRHLFKTEAAYQRFNSALAGKPALCCTDDRGYLYGQVCGVRVYAHRAVWAFEKGRMPRLDIDHINGKRDDNRLENLRIVTKKGNGRNRKLSSNNSSGISGVFWNTRDRRWIARIGEKTLGQCKQKSEAIAMRRAAERALGYHKNHGRKAA